MKTLISEIILVLMFCGIVYIAWPLFAIIFGAFLLGRIIRWGIDTVWGNNE